MKGWLDIFLTLITFGKFSFTNSGKKFIKALDEADIVIHAPGPPIIGDIYYNEDLLIGFDLLHLYRLFIVKFFKKKPVFFYAPSMGPFLKKSLGFIRKLILGKADLIIVREPISAEYLKKQLGIESFVTLDSALQNDIPENYLTKYGNISEILEFLDYEKTVGMVLDDLKWHPISERFPKLPKKILNCWLIVAAYLLKKGYRLLLMPFWLNELKENELKFLEEISKLNKEKISILPQNIDSYGQQAIISKLFCLLNMRYHPAVFAAKTGTPFISIYYEHKVNGFMEKIGFSDFTIDIKEISAEKIINKFTILEQNYEMIKDKLKTINPSLKEESKKTNKLIKNKLTQLGYI